MVDHAFQYPPGQEATFPVTIGRFRIVERAPGGRGSQGSVYRAIDPINDSQVALKVLENQFDSYAQSLLAALVGDQDMKELRREAEVLSSLRHPNIVRVIEAGEDTVYGPYVAMEWISGGDLKALLDNTPARKIAVPDALRIARGVLEGLVAAHESGVVHLDIKPSNVLLDGGGQAKLADFGIAGSAAVSDAMPGRGTLGYMAPEQQDLDLVEVVGPASDIYAVGIVLFEMLVGRLPSPGEDIRQLRPAIPTATANAVIRALDPDPHKRFASARDALDALDSSSTH